ncbi:hypothetical protein ACFYQ5_14185 [Streptomyces sp. NPDC005794]|uniref:hypothetical protein n=1 Tax=Streptomyces sp. NPDC005794 TaxID=3364733 RepID=UPI0036A77769
MTAAHDYEHLHHLMDRLSPRQVKRLRLIITQDDELSEVDQQIPSAAGEGGAETKGEMAGDVLPDGLRALFGSISAPADYAERHDDYIRARMERDEGTAE